MDQDYLLFQYFSLASLIQIQFSPRNTGFPEIQFLFIYFFMCACAFPEQHTNFPGFFANASCHLPWDFWPKGYEGVMI